jgi:hypothetical protein
MDTLWILSGRQTHSHRVTLCHRGYQLKTAYPVAFRTAIKASIKAIKAIRDAFQ